MTEIKPLKIAIITNRFWPDIGGAETNIFQQARLLAKNHEVTVLCPRRTDRPYVEHVEGFRLVNCLDVFHYNSSYPNKSISTFCPQMTYEILKGQFDVIQCFPSLNLNNKLAFVIAKLLRIPIIFCFFDFLDYADLLTKKPPMKSNILEEFDPGIVNKFILKNADYCLAISNKEVNFLKRFTSRVSYSPVPVLLEEYEKKNPNPRSKYQIPSDAFVFICVGRISKIKGQDVALEAFLKIQSKISNAYLVFVGRTDYEPEYFEKLKTIHSQIIFTGPVARIELISWLQHGNIHLIPVRFMNSGAVVVETWASGVPVIQSDAVDPNLVQDFENGLLFKSQDVDELAEKMLWSYQNRDQLSVMGLKGQKMVQEKYSYPTLIDLYQKIYSQIL